MHLLAFAIDDPAVSKNGAIGCALFFGCNCGEKGRLEPTAVLVCALKIEVCGPFECGVIVEHRKMS